MSVLHSRASFSDGKLLRRTALIALEQQCFELPDLLFSTYGDGILSGCHLSTTSDTITMAPGVVVFNSTLYALYEQTSIKYNPTDSVCYLKLYVGSEEIVNACATRRFTLKLTEAEVSASGEFELCRFRLQAGAYLRSQYTSFEDRSTMFDTMNIVHAKHSASGGDGISPDITKSYAHEILNLPAALDFDASVAIQWVQSAYPISSFAVRCYLSRVACLDTITEENGALFQGLVARLRQVKSGAVASADHQRTERRKIFID